MALASFPHSMPGLAPASEDEVRSSSYPSIPANTHYLSLPPLAPLPLLHVYQGTRPARPARPARAETYRA
jgi:hypothetical protein